MLQQLAPMAGAKVAALEAEATNANCSRGKRVSTPRRAAAAAGRRGAQATWRTRVLTGSAGMGCAEVVWTPGAQLVVGAAPAPQPKPRSLPHPANHRAR